MNEANQQDEADEPARKKQKRSDSTPQMTLPITPFLTASTECQPSTSLAQGSQSYPIKTTSDFKNYLTRLNDANYLNEEAKKLKGFVLNLRIHSLEALLDRLVTVQARGNHTTLLPNPPKSSLAKTRFENLLVEIYHQFLIDVNDPRSGIAYWCQQKMHAEFVKIWGQTTKRLNQASSD
jgi:hypothetical protein